MTAGRVPSGPDDLDGRTPEDVRQKRVLWWLFALVPALLLLLVGAGIGSAVLRQRGAGPGLGGLDPSRGGAEPTASETRRLEAELGRFEG